MEEPFDKSQVKEPDLSYGPYSYDDYLTWELDEMVELIQGKVFKKTAAPRRIHQYATTILLSIVYQKLTGGPCQVYPAPFDFRLPKQSLSENKIFIVVQPDVCVVCDPDKLDEKGCIGAPDLVVEILSPGNKQHGLKRKHEVYEEAGVKEYWLLDPESQTLLINTLENNSYKASRLMTSGDTATSYVFPGFELDLEELFNKLH